MTIKYILFAFFFTLSFSLLAQQKIEPYEQKINGTALSFTMEAIPAGEFEMGSDRGTADVQPVHKVKLDAYLMGTVLLTWCIYEPLLFLDSKES